MHKDVAPTSQTAYTNIAYVPRTAEAGNALSPERNADDEASASAARPVQQMDIRTLLRDKGDLRITAEVKVPDTVRTVPVASNSNDHWDSVDTSNQPWWLEHDLNFEVFDTSLFDFPVFDEPWFQALNSHPNAVQAGRTDDMLRTQSPTAQSQHLADDTVQKAWFTHVKEVYPKDGHMETTQSEKALETNDSFELGNSFRARACQRLTTQQNANPLPSIGLLVSRTCSLKLEHH
jgi:hypothetical protein